VVTDRDRSVVAWVAVIGAVSVQDVMARFDVGRTVAYRRLRALVDHGLMTRARLVHGQPTLYAATREGAAWAGMPQVEPARVGVATTRHWAVCARLAAILECEHGCREVWGERRLRAAELRPVGRSSAPGSASCRTAGRGCGARISCCFPPVPHRWRSRSSCWSRPRAGSRGSAARGRAVGWCRRFGTTRYRMWRVPFPVPFRSSTPTTHPRPVAERSLEEASDDRFAA
jgi:hypothetical protein